MSALSPTSRPATLRVALPVPLPQLFDYLAPGASVPVPADLGRRVRVPFGTRELVGVVVGLGETEPEAAPLREIHEWLDEMPLLHGELAQSLQWLARYTHAPLGEVLATALPGP
ncbi:MAG TPA: primosomal protein N', partial [Stenotrophomonas sp.]